MQTERKDILLFIHLILFIILGYGVILLINLFFSFVFESYFPMHIKENKLESYMQENKAIKYLFLGDSHTYDGIFPHTITGAFNFGNGGESYIEIYLHLRDFIENKKYTIKNIVLEIDGSMLLKDATDRFYIRTCYYKKKISLSEIKEMYPSESIIDMYLKYNFCFLGRGEFFALPRVFTKENFNSDGTVFSSKKTKEIKDRKTKEIPVDILSYTYFKKILDYLDKKNINILFITYPVSKGYYTSISQKSIKKHEKLIYSEIDKYKKKYEKNYKRNHEGSYEKLFFNNDEYFTDGVHLNYSGSKVFTEKLNNYIHKKYFIN